MTRTSAGLWQGQGRVKLQLLGRVVERATHSELCLKGGEPADECGVREEISNAEGMSRTDMHPPTYRK